MKFETDVYVMDLWSIRRRIHFVYYFP